VTKRISQNLMPRALGGGAAIASAMPLIGCGRRAGANMSIYVDVESDHGTDGAVIVDFAVRVHFRTLVGCVILFVNSSARVPRCVIC
jgi:hypothetical protein